MRKISSGSTSVSLNLKSCTAARNGLIVNLRRHMVRKDVTAPFRHKKKLESKNHDRSSHNMNVADVAE